MQSFLQSSEWEEIQRRMGRETWRIAGKLVIRHDLPLGLHYFYSPRPPAVSQEFITEAAALARSTGAMFLKVDPAEPLLEIRDPKLEIRPTYSLQPSTTVLINCGKSDRELLDAMHEKTRYNVRLAERHGVRVEPITAEDVPRKFDSFWSLLGETARRERFSPHPRAHYRSLLGVRSERFSNEFWFAELDGQSLTCAIVNWFELSGTVTYLHGASSRARREVMAPHLLHWEITRAARARGFQTYDFGGIDEDRWPGVTRFKRGFGGRVHTYPPSHDFVFRPWLYRLYRLQHRLRRRP